MTENLVELAARMRREKGDRKLKFDGTLDELSCRISELFPDIRTNVMTGEVEGAPDAALARFRIEAVTGKTPKKENVRDAMRIVADQRKYDPLAAMLDSLPTWDGEPRLGKWLITYAKAPDLPYVEVVGRKWLISAVARARRAGCQCDYSLVLQGPQRTGKTSALRIIGGPLYRSMTGKPIGNKDTKHELRSCWIAEFADLGALPRSEVGVIKAFLTDTHDSYTWKYETSETVSARRCVFAITDNPDGSGWLSDTTGADRFWPVNTGIWDLEELARDRDQLLAEAMTAYADGEPWWLERDDPVQEELHNQQASLQQHDEWRNLIAGYVVGTTGVLTSGDVMTTALGLKSDKWTKADQMRVAKILKNLGFTRKKQRVGGESVWAWERP
jgi:predicted P-loop ATPase